MRKIWLYFSLVITSCVILSCSKTGMDDGKSSGRFDSAAPGGGLSGGASSPGNGGSDSSGLITAGEWNDIVNWNFWNGLLGRDTIKEFPATWGFYTQNKVTVILKDAAGNLLHDAVVKLEYGGKTVTARTSNDGRAELFQSLFIEGFNPGSFSVSAIYQGQPFDLGTFSAGETLVSKTIPVAKSVNNTLDILFVVDATGSMGDELSYLKNELKNVINRAGSQLPGKTIRMGSVFYRDFGDEYLTRTFPFTTSADLLNNFINAQSADNGGDFPEAVDEALEEAIGGQVWSGDAVNRLLFLVLDAPPHKTPAVVAKLKETVTLAQEKGIRVIPISASGIDWETEFLLRFLSVATNSTYVFITNHSGIGNPHHNPTVGDYQVEYLNDLMVRLIAQYGKNND